MATRLALLETATRATGGADQSIANFPAMHKRTTRMGVFCAVPLAVYAITRLTARLGRLPVDGRKAFLGGDFAADVPRLLEVAVVVGWLVGVDEPARARWLGAPRRCLPLVCLALVVSPLFSLLSSVPGLQVDLTDVRAWSSLALSLFACGGVIICSLLAAQLYTAYFSLRRIELYSYLAQLAAIGAVYGIAVGAAARSYHVNADVRAPHLHHLYVRGKLWTWSLLGLTPWAHSSSLAHRSVLCLPAALDLTGGTAVCC